MAEFGVHNLYVLSFKGQLFMFGGGFICKEIDDAPLWILNLGEYNYFLCPS